MERPPDPKALVLVEGVSDRLAVEALARRHGRDLAREGVELAVLGGAHGVVRMLPLLPRATRLAALVDAGEEPGFRRALDRHGREAELFVCEADLEDELVRALGPDAVLAVVEREGDLRAFRTLQRQPEWRGRPVEAQLRRFFGSGGSRKTVYAPLLVEALGLDDVPPPLAALLERV